MEYLKSICPGIGDARVASRFHSYSYMHVWESTSRASLTFDAAEMSHGEGHLGVIGENAVVQAALFDRLQELGSGSSAPLRMYIPRMLKSLERLPVDGLPQSEGPLQATLVPPGEAEEAAEVITARLVVAADGAMSSVRRIFGFSGWGYGYNQRAIVCSLRVDEQATAEKAMSTAYQRYLPTGPVALLPLREGHMSLVWSTTPSEARRLQMCSDVEFIDELNRALQAEPDGSLLSPLSASIPVPFLYQSPLFGSSEAEQSSGSFAETALRGPQRLLQAIGAEVESMAKTLATAPQLSDDAAAMPLPVIASLQSKRFSFDLKQEQAWRYAHARLALVGDAAHTIHPMAGQGLNLGIADAECLTREIKRSVESGADIGTLAADSALINYERERAPVALGFGLGLGALHLTYGAQGRSALGLARGAGMGVIDFLKPLKERIAKIAMGS
eukprot:scaffold922_cov327-Pinguiococcus_pyrenoidosus.AAC.34